MPPNVKVCINGFVLSTILFDCTNNTGDQEGFLYGSVTKSVRREINDQSMSNTQEDILISICSSVPCGSFLSFYNNVGEIKREDLAYNLGDRNENIVGWYRFRRYSAMFPSAREQSTHRNLRNLFSEDKTINEDYFVFSVLSSSNLPNFATHSYDYSFFCERNSSFNNLPLTILNLGDTRNSYRSGSMALPFMNSSSFNSVLTSSWNFGPFFESENQIHQFHQRLRSKLESLQEELAASDAINVSLEDDIRRLSNELQSLLSTQERLASAAAAARELEFADTNERENAREEAEIREALEASAREAAEVIDKDTVEVSGEIAEVIVSEATLTAEKESPGAGDKKVVDTFCGEVTESVEEKMDVVQDICESSRVGEAASSKREMSLEDLLYNYTCSIKVDSEINKGNEPINSVDDESGDSGSSEAKEKGANANSLKRLSVDPLEDVRSTKRKCPDKYFEWGEYLDDKSLTSSVDEITTSNKQEDSAFSSQLLVVDPDSGEMSSAQNEGDNQKFEVTSFEIVESTVPSPASNVEIIISESEAQQVGSAMLVNESTSDDDLSDNKESEALLSAEESTSLVGIKKSISDTAISALKEESSSRCASAQSKFMSQATVSAVKDNDEDVSSLKVSISDGSSAKVNPPFIIYASKEAGDPVPHTSSKTCQQRDECKPEESSSEEKKETGCGSNEKKK